MSTKKIKGRGERRIVTDKVMNKRWRLLMSWMEPRGGETKEDAMERQRFKKGFLRKYNLACGCSMCKPIKWRDSGKGDYKKRKYYEI